LLAGLKSKRLFLLSFLSLASGMPLGWVLNSYQFFLVGLGVPKTTLGLLSGVSIAWTVKFLWSPLVDRYAPAWPGRRRSWVMIAQLALAAAFAALAAFAWKVRGTTSGLPGSELALAATLAFLVAFFSATQDIAYDAYAVEAIRPEEQGPVSGLRIAWYRVGMLVAGAATVSLSDWLPWPVLFLGLGAIFVAFVPVTLAAPEPERPSAPPRSLSSAVVEPFRTFFRRPEAISIALFLFFYKFGDNMGGTMVNPFLKDLCFSNAEAGAAIKTLGILATIGGSLLGGALLLRLGLGRGLWIYGFLQAGANLLYSLAALSRNAPLDLHQCAALPAIDLATRAATYTAIAGEWAAQGMANAALSVFLLRICEKRYSATQFALLSSLFGLGRWASGLPSGWLADRLGYPLFFAVCATVMAIPGFLFLQRISPFGRREVAVAPPAEPDSAG
jgi:PAT family beta-lactamase induction signal transducer AmpG